MKKNELLHKIKTVFKQNKFILHEDEIIDHICDECNFIKNNLKDVNHLEMTEPLIKEHSFDLPLLSRKALHFFIPNYLIYSINNLESSVCEFTIYHIVEHVESTDFQDRFSLLSDNEKEIIKDFILFIKKSDIYIDFKKEIDKGIRNWKINIT